MIARLISTLCSLQSAGPGTRGKSAHSLPAFNQEGMNPYAMWSDLGKPNAVLRCDGGISGVRDKCCQVLHGSNLFPTFRD
jgi:hypothetical protein